MLIYKLLAGNRNWIVLVCIPLQLETCIYIKKHREYMEIKNKSKFCYWPLSGIEPESPNKLGVINHYTLMAVVIKITVYL